MAAIQQEHKGGRTPLCWLVVNPDGKLLAILDSESEAYWFTRNRGHANGAVYFKAPIDYATAPDLQAQVTKLRAALRECYTEEGAAGMREGLGRQRRRLEAINGIVEHAL